MNEVTVGRIVHYVMPDYALPDGEIRPAIVVRKHATPGLCNLQVFTDGANDGVNGNVRWETSVPYDEHRSRGTWHWPEKK